MNAFVESVHKYIANINIKQALLIDGEWGCGKTHFIRPAILVYHGQVWHFGI